MIYLLIFFLLLLTMVAYNIAGKDITSPWFISNSVYLICTIVAAINLGRWGVKFDVSTVLVIFIAQIALGFGELFIRFINTRKKTQLVTRFYEINISLKWVLTLLSFALIINYYQYRNAIEIAIKVLGSADSETWLGDTRNGLNAKVIDTNYLLAIFGFSLTGIGYFFSFAIINNISITGFRSFINRKWYYILLIFPLFISEILSTSRNGFIFFIVSTTITYFLIHKKKSPDKKLNLLHFAFYSLIGLIIFLFIFVQLGKLTGKVNQNNQFEWISIYIGSSIAALNEFMIGKDYSRGAETFVGIRSLIERFGCTIDNYDIFLPTIYFRGGSNTNIYTALRSYIIDFGFIGMVFLQFIIGTTYGAIHQYVLSKNKINAWIIIFPYLMGYFVYDVFTPQSVNGIFSITQSFAIFFMLTAYYLFYPNKKNN